MKYTSTDRLFNDYTAGHLTYAEAIEAVHNSQFFAQDDEEELGVLANMADVEAERCEEAAVQQELEAAWTYLVEAGYTERTQTHYVAAAGELRQGRFLPDSAGVDRAYDVRFLQRPDGNPDLIQFGFHLSEAKSRGFESE